MVFEVAVSGAGLTGGDARNRPDSLLGSSVGNYEVKALLGEGGMGTVYLAQHAVMGWPAAIKVLRGSLADDQVLVKRFINEARIIRAVRHPNIVEILDIGLLPDGRPYLLMELLEGETLGDRLARCGRLAVTSAIDIICQTALALDVAHAKGITHRDLKPDNLFLLPDPDDPARDKVKVLDFGIAKLRDGDGRGPSAHTRSGVLLGTPAYMSPEQCQGIARDIDHRSDIYALCVILYQMLAGKPPFVSAGTGDVLIMHVATEAPPIRQERPDVPGFIEAAILRGLAKRREQRFASMTDLADALRSAPPAELEVPVRAAVAPAAAGAVEPVRPAPAGVPPTAAMPTPVSWSRAPTAQRSTTWSTHTPSRRAAALGLSAALAGVVIFVAAGRRMGRDRAALPALVPPAAKAPAAAQAAIDVTRAPAAVPAQAPAGPRAADPDAGAGAGMGAVETPRKPVRRPRVVAPASAPNKPPRKAKPWL
jgi:serine/threonine protein kinase